MLVCACSPPPLTINHHPLLERLRRGAAADAPAVGGRGGDVGATSLAPSRTIVPGGAPDQAGPDGGWVAPAAAPAATHPARPPLLAPRPAPPPPASAATDLTRPALRLTCHGG